MLVESIFSQFAFFRCKRPLAWIRLEGVGGSGSEGGSGGGGGGRGPHASSVDEIRFVLFIGDVELAWTKGRVLSGTNASDGSFNNLSQRLKTHHISFLLLNTTT